jgi:hypothetical protein
MELLIGLGIAALFLVPAVLRPTLGRALVGLFFLGGALVNLAYTLPHLPGSLEGLVATAPVPLYRAVVEGAVARRLDGVLVLLVVAFELAAGVLALWRGPLARLALLGAGLWGLGMLPVVPPAGLPIGVALTGAPGLAGLLLARHAYPESVFGAAARRLRRLRPAPAGGHAPPPSLPVRAALTAPLVLSLLTAALLAVTSVAGLLLGRRGLYSPDPRTLPAFLGQDALTLVVGLPLLLAAVWLARRGSLRGLLLWQGLLFYLAYSYAYYVLSPVFNALYLAYLAIVSMSIYGFVALLLATDAEAVRAHASPRAPVRLLGGALVVVPSLLGVAWGAAIVSALVAGAAPGRVEQVVWPLDLVVAFPAMFWGGVWLWRRQALGYLVAATLLVKGGFLGLTLAVNTWLATTFWGQAPDPAVPL